MKQFIIALLAFALLTSCGGNEKASEEKEHAHEHAGDEETTVAEITQEQVNAVGITWDTIQYRDLITSIRANGLLSVPNQNKAIVTAATDGFVKTLLVLPGDHVRKGQVIATLVNPGIARTQQELQSVLAQIKLTELELQRQRELVEGNAAPLKNLQRVQTELASLVASRNGLQQQLSAIGVSTAAVASGKINTTIAILAPISGAVSAVSAEIGAQINAAMPIARIVNNSDLHLDLFVYEKDLPRLKKDQSISFTLTNNPGENHEARIFSIGTAFENDTKTIPVHAVVKGDKTGLIEGMNVTAVINTGTGLLPAVPSEAIVANGGQDYVFVLMNHGGAAEADHHGHDHAKSNSPVKAETGAKKYTFEKWPVAKGVTDMGYTAIIPVKPLPANAGIVTKGAFFVMAKLVNKGEHEH
ncbi:efflux RND transporter periplasmic adaptor subunit [Filimonas effusa]|uniref:Efflux RND transporter periplasmic adaptor subunit n=1 Tax=Filimonas effusa TaxID=2508721 RepID=A0A4Q1DAF5_9BACT|nr:efflux RND transporter periplasmic adaptor subunit [Filimonas effusa]RXK86220.1 efflux RND transporter periplasmic adaptor subunit [Filimonas effusa]